MLAKMSGQQSMQEVLDIVAQKLVQNLMSSGESSDPEHIRIVDLSLDVLSQYLNNSVSLRHLSELPMLKQLASSHISQFNIL